MARIALTEISQRRIRFCLRAERARLAPSLSQNAKAVNPQKGFPCGFPSQLDCRRARCPEVDLDSRSSSWRYNESKSNWGALWNVFRSPSLPSFSSSSQAFGFGVRIHRSKNRHQLRPLPASRSLPPLMRRYP